MERALWVDRRESQQSDITEDWADHPSGFEAVHRPDCSTVEFTGWLLCSWSTHGEGESRSTVIDCVWTEPDPIRPELGPHWNQFILTKANKIRQLCEFHVTNDLNLRSLLRCEHKSGSIYIRYFMWWLFMLRNYSTSPHSAVARAWDCGSEGLGFESHQSCGIFQPWPAPTQSWECMGPMGRDLVWNTEWNKS